jgi:hypothetical protein
VTENRVLQHELCIWYILEGRSLREGRSDLTCHKLTGAGNGRGRKYRIAYTRYKGKWSERIAIYPRLKLQEVLLERLVTEYLNTPKRRGEIIAS